MSVLVVRMKTVLISAVVSIWSLMASSSVAQQLGWADLQPDIPQIEDPFLLLSDEQLFELGTLAKLDMLASLSPQQVADKKAITSKLKDEGLDVNWLFSKRIEVMQHRRRMATEPNMTLVGKRYDIPGFVTPVEFDNDVVTKFFLVPTSGACIHTPPPPANQIVLVSYPQGLKMKSLYSPVWVSGELVMKRAKADVSYVDGVADVETVYQMSAVDIRDYE